MEKRITKKEIVKMLLKNNELDSKDEEELLDLLVDQPISIDVDKQEEAKMTFGDKVADKVSEVAGSWGFIIAFTSFLIFWVILNTIILKENAESYIVSTLEPWDIESEEQLNEFEISRSLLMEI